VSACSEADCVYLPVTIVTGNLQRQVFTTANVLRHCSTILKRWVSRFDVWPYLETFTIDVAHELRAAMGTKVGLTHPLDLLQLTLAK
jgi:Sucrose synthase